MTTYTDDALKAADNVIGLLFAHRGMDYSSARNAIAEAFDEYLFEGTWDATVLASEGGRQLPDLRIIEENEYDQSMDEDEDRPENPVGMVSSGHYVFVV